MIQATGIEESQISLQESQIGSLSPAKLKGKTKEDLMEAAKNFEAVFLNQLFNAMEATVEKDGMFSGGKGEETFKSLFYDEIARNASSNSANSFGFAKQIYEQMKDQVK